MRVGYVRVSKGEQEDALVQQTARIDKAGAMMVFSDIESGKSDKRQNFNKMLTMCREGQVTEVVITRIDRLARSVITIHKTMALFEKLNVKLVVLDAPIDDSSSPFGWFSVNQMAGLAEFESRLLQNRIKHGLAYSREQNKACPNPPFGYARINEKYAPDMTVNDKSGKTHWQIAAEIVEYYLLDKASLRNTVQYFIKKYNVKFSPTGLRSWLRNPVLQGHTAYNIKNNRCQPDKWDIRENTHQALISKETARDVELRINDNQRLWGKNFNGATANYLLAGQILCTSCGYKCYLHGKKSTNPIRCKRRRTYGETACSNKTATSLNKIIDAVDNALTTKAIELKNYTVNGQSNVEDTPEIIELKNKLESLQRLPQDSIIEEAIEKMMLKIQQLQQKSNHNINISNFVVNQLRESFSDYEFFKTLPEGVKKELYKTFVKYVKILNGDVVEVALIDMLR
ncbi:MAG: recombinase family protein [Scytonematopsis contorta HA4267-MV1]|jgi:DNA invertase Pin-like site-specific DNA recombinase|nr:recombinase family protein [Scytonematopsis contorta HA4267-MV1]